MLDIRPILSRLPNDFLIRIKKSKSIKWRSNNTKDVIFDSDKVYLHYLGDEKYLKNIHQIYSNLLPISKSHINEYKIYFPRIISISLKNTLTIEQCYQVHKRKPQYSTSQIVRIARKLFILLNDEDLLDRTQFMSYPEIILSLLHDGKYEVHLTDQINEYINKVWPTILKGQIGIVHGDLWSDNILLSEDGYALIDYDKMHINSAEYDVVFSIIQNLMKTNQKLFRRWYYPPKWGTVCNIFRDNIKADKKLSADILSNDKYLYRHLERLIFIRVLLDLMAGSDRWHPFPALANKSIMALLVEILHSEKSAIIGSRY